MGNKTWSGKLQLDSNSRSGSDNGLPSMSSEVEKIGGSLPSHSNKHWISKPNSIYFRTKLIRAQSGISWDIYMPEESYNLVEVCEKDRVVQVEWYRWVIVMEVSLLIFSNSMLWITFAPRTETFNEYFGFEKSNPYYIAALSVVMLATFPIFIMPILYLDQFFSKRDLRPTINTVGRYGSGLRDMCLLAAFLNALGAWIRYFGGKSFWWVFFGQAISGICGIVAMGIAPKLSNIWFPFEQRNTATAIILTFNLLGTALTFMITPEAVDPERMETTIPIYMLGQALSVSILLILMFITFRRGPSHHASSTMPHIDYNISHLIPTLYKCVFRSRFSWLNLAYSIVSGTQVAIQTLLINLILPVFPDYGEKLVSYMAFYSTLAGIGGTFFVGPFLDRTLRYRATNWTLFIITFLSLLLTCVFLEIKSWIGVYISVMVYGVFSYALTPVVFQYSVIKYPHRDEMVLTGILNVSNTVVGIALIYILSAPGLNNIIPDAVAPYFPMRWGSWVIVILNFVCLLFLLKFK